MAIPGINNTILDGGLGVTSPATSTPLVFGVFGAGALNTPTLISNQRQLREQFGSQSPGADCVGGILGFAGGPVVVVRTASSTAATYDGGSTAAVVASTGAGADNEINLDVSTSAPLNNYEAIVTIVTGGAQADVTFTYSLDGGKTTSPALAAAATVALGTSGVTLEFEAGSTAAYVAGATYSFTARAAHYSAADLATAKTAVDASVLNFDFAVYAGEPDTSADAATLFATVASQATSFHTLGRPLRSILSGGYGTAAAGLTALAGLSGDRVALVFGRYQSPAPFPITGRSLPSVPNANRAAQLAAANVISTDLAKVQGANTVGAAPGAPQDGLSHDEFSAESGLDAAKVGTARTYRNRNGVYLTNVWLKSAPGSDFQYWQHGRIMDETEKVANVVHQGLLHSQLRIKTDGSGSLTEAAAQGVERKVKRALDTLLLEGIAIDGTPGHVSGYEYQVDRTNNIAATGQLIFTLVITPFGYAKQIVGTFAYTLSV